MAAACAKDLLSTIPASAVRRTLTLKEATKVSERPHGKAISLSCANLMTDIYEGSRSKTMIEESVDHPDPIARNSTLRPIVSTHYIKPPDPTIP